MSPDCIDAEIKYVVDRNTANIDNYLANLLLSLFVIFEFDIRFRFLPVMEHIVIVLLMVLDSNIDYAQLRLANSVNRANCKSYIIFLSLFHGGHAVVMSNYFSCFHSCGSWYSVYVIFYVYLIQFNVDELQKKNEFKYTHKYILYLIWLVKKKKRLTITRF